VIALVLLAVRVAMTPLLLRFVNQKLDELPEYRGHIADVDLQLIRGAYRIDSLVLEKRSGKVPVPFLKARTVDLSIEWKALLKGALVGEIEILGPEVNFVQAPPGAGPKTKEERGQTGIDAAWTEKVKDLFPFEINRFRIREGQVHYRDAYRKPKVDIHLDHLEAEATGLTNARENPKDLPSEFHATGRAMGHAALKVDMKLAPLAEAPTFDLNAELTGLKLPELNDFFRAYAKVDVEGGTFNLYTEAAAADGRFKGYVKPLMKDLKILDSDDADDGPIKLMWETVVAGVTELLENQPKDQTATQIPMAGSFENPKAGIWPTVGSLLRNAFLQALRPSLDRSIALGDVKPGQGKSAKADGKEIEREKKKESDRQDGTKVSEGDGKKKKSG
jgi:hypothetical protein